MPASPAPPTRSPKRKGAPEIIAHAEPQPVTELKPQTQADVANLLNTTLGDLLVAGLIKDPEDAGRIIASALSHIRRAARPRRRRKPTLIPVPIVGRLAKPRHRRTRRRRPPSNPIFEFERQVRWKEGNENNTKTFRVTEGDSVDLEKWPTKADPVYESKTQYRNLL